MADLPYSNLVEKILKEGKDISDRTGIGTLSIFGAMLEIDISTHFPLLTTKKVFFKGVKEELLWFLRGSTNAKELASKGVHIWDANTDRKTLDSLGFKDRPEGDLGPSYGFQWRHFGANYKDCLTTYTDGVDQIRKITEQLINNPRSRRIVMSAWNAKDVEKMSLPPCHHTVQFLVDDESNLTCISMLRSCDVGCGLPFNIASYALLTNLLAKTTGLKPSKLVIQIGDAHIYKEHIPLLKEQITRIPKEPPTLLILDDPKDVWEYQSESIILYNYESHPAISLKMFV